MNRFLVAFDLVNPPPLHQLSERQIAVGICAMMKKSKSKPMTQILERLCKFDYIDVVVFPEEVILEEPVDKWPLCDCLISFHSKGERTWSGVLHPDQSLLPCRYLPAMFMLDLEMKVLHLVTEPKQNDF